MKAGKGKILICLLMIFAMVLAGCGGNTDDPGNENPGTENPGSESAGDEAMSLKVGMLGKDIKVACIIIADQLGYYGEEGLTVEFETVSNLSDGITAVDMGKLDVLPFGMIPSATFVAQGSDVVVFGGTISEGSEIITLPENADDYKTLEDFRGKKIGCYRMETGHMVTKGLLVEAGMDVNEDVEFILLDSQQTIIEAVRKGEVDLGFLNSGQGYIAKQAGLEVAARVSDFESGYPCCRQTTSRATLTENREALVRFQTANLRALEIIETNRETASNALMEYSGQPREYVEAVIYGLDGEYENAMVVSLDPNKKKVERFYEIMKVNGDIPADTEYEMADHIDVSVYEEALNALLERDPDSSVYQRLQAEFRVNNL